MYYYDKDFYLLYSNFNNLQIKLLKNIFYFFILIAISIIFKSIIFLPLIIIPISLNIILFLLNLNYDEKLYTKLMKKKLKNLDKIKKSSNYEFYNIIIQHELKNLTTKQTLQKLNNCRKSSLVDYAQFKIYLLDKIKKNEEITENEKKQFIKLEKNYKTSSPIEIFEKCRILLLLQEYNETLDILNNFNYTKDVANICFVFYKNIFLYIIYKNESNQKADYIYSKIQKFFIINKFKIYFKNILNKYYTKKISL